MGLLASILLPLAAHGYPLQDLGPSVLPHDINNRGQVIGRGYKNGQPHGYLLTPLR